MTAFIRFFAFAAFFSSFANGFITAQSQQLPQTPVSEMRGAWVATVANIDWPSAPGLSPERQRAEFDSLLDVLKAMNMNAVFVQVRPAGDAFYNSPVVPWSKYLTGQQGLAPNPPYDPLEYMIKAAHDRRMEFHAWLNPYRATFDLDTASLSPMHLLKSLPPDRKREWFYQYGNRWYFNPASPLVRTYLTNVVKDIVLRYDVDGIHFDDYFYPYPVANQPEIDDLDLFASDPRGFTNIQDWRRDNINLLIKNCSEGIKSIKPYVRFGIAPYGVWRNSSKDPINGSATGTSVTSYDDNYADVLKWLQNGWIDYVAPQLYWSIGFPPADYKTLINWWSQHTYGRQLYIGHAVYKVNNWPADPNWYLPDEINRQVALNRNTQGVHGSIFYSVKPLLYNPLGVQDSLITSIYPTPALVPAHPALSLIPPATPQICRIAGAPGRVKMAWHVCNITNGDQMPYYYAVYRFNGKEVGDFSDIRNLLTITPFNSEKTIFEDMTPVQGQYYTYVVLGYNRLNVPSYSSDPVTIKKTERSLKRQRKGLFGK
ncbi:MAG: family 10 glycosylhydrolase [Saprospiraceae bacterium]|nr:family 10 glycosylhydrolase [Saprospiraceae bacterium]